MELIGPKSTREEIRGVYNDMYQLWRVPSKSPCIVEMEEEACQEILDCVKECLWHRWDHAQPEERPRQSSAGASKPDPQAEFWDQMHDTYDHYRDLTEGLFKEALTMVWDVHHWVLVAMALLEEKTEWLSC